MKVEQKGQVLSVDKDCTRKALLVEQASISAREFSQATLSDEKAGEVTHLR